MDISAAFRRLNQQRQHFLEAKTREGQRATNKSSRQQLLFQYRKDKLSRMDGDYHHIKTCMINHAYPPSTMPLSELRPISLSQLRLETHHAGTVLIVRTFGHPVRLTSVQNAVEDLSMDVDQLAIYDANPAADAEQVLPNGAIFAIKEPYYKISSAGGPIIRVDHPSDLIRLHSTHPLIPTPLKPTLMEIDQDPLQHKHAGNAAFKDKKYAQAVEAYTFALHACGENNDALKYDLHRNRSLANIHLERFQPAVEDAKAAFISDANDEVKRQCNVKALFRAGRAFYCLEDFLAAQSQFGQLLSIAPTDENGQKQLDLTKARIKEATSGVCNFEAITKSVNKAYKRLDHASFTANVEVRAAGQKGKGLFATKDIKAGELVLVEKAFAVNFNSENDSDMHRMINLNTNTVRSGNHVRLFYKLVQKARHNSDQAKRLFDLSDDGYTPKCTAKVIDGATAIDTFQIANIMGNNCFGCADTTSLDEAHAPVTFDSPSASVGIWIVASYMNHTCDANARRSFMGDCMIVRANKDIAQGEEIFIQYIGVLSDQSETQANLQKGWKFKCSCKMCIAESNTPPAQRPKRQKLMGDLAAFFEANTISDPRLVHEAAIAEAIELYCKIDATYDREVYKNMARIPLAQLGTWLSNAYQTERNRHKIGKRAQTVLRDLGYQIDVQHQSLRIDRTNCYSDHMEIDAAMHMALSNFFAGNFALGAQFTAFAGERYLAAYGTMRGFDSKYDS